MNNRQLIRFRNRQKTCRRCKTSFMTKCEKDVSAACDKQATDRNLAGAAKASVIRRAILTP